MNKVIVLGSLNMDLSIASKRLPKNGETLNGYGFFMNPGGKGGNQAVACALSEAQVYMIANVGHDEFGKVLKDSLYKSGVNVQCVRETEANTGVAVIMCIDNDNRILLENGANHKIEIDFLKETIDKYASYQDIFLTQLENNLSAVEKGLEYAKQKGMYTVFNPAPAIPLSKEIYKYVDLLIINQSECELLCGIYPDNEESIEASFEKFKKLGCDVIITLGVKGSVVSFEGKRYAIKAYQVESVDTTGAGDTYVGVLCAMLAKHISFEKALIYANAASALAVTKRGAQSSIPTLEEIEKFIKGSECIGIKQEEENR